MGRLEQARRAPDTPKCAWAKQSSGICTQRAELLPPCFQNQGSQEWTHILTVPQMEGMRLGHARMFLPREPEPQQGTGTISLDAKEVFQADSLACFLSDLHLCSPSISLQSMPKACWGLQAGSELWAQFV